MKTSLVVPAYNEEKGLSQVVREYLDIGTFQVARALVGGKTYPFKSLTYVLVLVLLSLVLMGVLG